MHWFLFRRKKRCNLKHNQWNWFEILRDILSNFCFEPLVSDSKKLTLVVVWTLVIILVIVEIWTLNCRIIDKVTSLLITHRLRKNVFTWNASKTSPHFLMVDTDFSAWKTKVSNRVTVFLSYCSSSKECFLTRQIIFPRYPSYQNLLY